MLSSSLSFFFAFSFLNIAFGRAYGAAGGAEATEPQSFGSRIGLKCFAWVVNSEGGYVQGRAGNNRDAIYSPVITAMLSLAMHSFLSVGP